MYLAALMDTQHRGIWGITNGQYCHLHHHQCSRVLSSLRKHDSLEKWYYLSTSINSLHASALFNKHWGMWLQGQVLTIHVHGFVILKPYSTYNQPYSQSLATLINGSLVTLNDDTLNNGTWIMFAYLTLLISYVYAVFYTIYSTLSMPLSHRSSIYLYVHILIPPFRFVCIR
jgi:hypothetical protein